MAEVEKDLNGNILTRKEEINIIYDGESFKNQMEISSLTSQLKATESIIKDLVSEMYKQKKTTESNKNKVIILLLYEHQKSRK